MGPRFIDYDSWVYISHKIPYRIAFKLINQLDRIREMKNQTHWLVILISIRNRLNIELVQSYWSIHLEKNVHRWRETHTLPDDHHLHIKLVLFLWRCMLMTQIVPLPISMHHAWLFLFSLLFFLSSPFISQSENELHDMVICIFCNYLCLWQANDIIRTAFDSLTHCSHHSRNHRWLFAPICLWFFSVQFAQFHARVYFFFFVR